MKIEKTLKYRFYKYVKYHKQELSINQIMNMWEPYFDSISYNDLTTRCMLISSLHAHDILLPYLKIMVKHFVNDENLTSCVEKLFKYVIWSYFNEYHRNCCSLTFTHKYVFEYMLIWCNTVDGTNFWSSHNENFRYLVRNTTWRELIKILIQDYTKIQTYL